MVPSIVGLLVLLVGVGAIYAGVHGLPGLLDVRPVSTYGGVGSANVQ